MSTHDPAGHQPRAQEPEARGPWLEAPHSHLDGYAIDTVNHAVARRVVRRIATRADLRRRTSGHVIMNGRRIFFLRIDQS